MLKHLIYAYLISVAFINCTEKKTITTESVLVLRGATIIDGTGNSSIENGVIVIEKGRITSIGKESDIEIPKESKTIDVKGKWIIPGMIDMHVHFMESARPWTSPYWFDAQSIVPYDEEVAFMKSRIRETLKKYICAGVTSVVPLGAITWELEIRDKYKSDTFTPNILPAGGYIGNIPSEVTFGNFPFDDEIPGFWISESLQADSLISILFEKKINLIKVVYFPDKEYTLEDFLPKVKAISEASQKRGINVSAHAYNLNDVKELIRVGVNILAHSFVDPIDQEFIDLANKNNVTITTTLGLFDGWNRVLSGDYKLMEMEKCCGDQDVIKSWKEWKDIPKNNRPKVPEFVELWSLNKSSVLLDNIKKANEQGVLISIGSDGGNIGSMHGSSYHKELSLLQEAGIKPMDILMAATINGAKALGMEGLIGSLEKGKQADLLILNENPLEDVSNYSKIKYVMVRGTLIDRTELVNDGYRK